MSSNLKKELIILLPRLRRFAFVMTRSSEEADDLTQEACLKALGNASQWDETKPLDRWLFRIMRNLWISEIRRRKIRLGQGQVPADEANELTSHDSAEENLAASQLYGFVTALPEELATVLLMVSVEGYTYAEVAELLDIPIGTVMSRIHRARKVLSKQIREPEGVTQ